MQTEPIKFRSPLGIGVQELYDEFQRKISRLDPCDRVVDHLGARQWVAETEEWKR